MNYGRHLDPPRNLGARQYYLEALKSEFTIRQVEDLLQ